MALAVYERLSYWYPGAESPALDGVCASIGTGLTLVTGPSGGGKSTLLRVLNGLVPRFHGGRLAGRACVVGLPVPETPTAELARRVGFVFQDPEAQGVYTTVERDVAFGLENLGVPRAEMRERVEAALAAVGLEALRARPLATLSGGERQRAALASALALRPALIVLDEPTSQLDQEGAAAIAGACVELARAGVGVVVAEQRLERLLPAAREQLVVDGGRVEIRVPRPPDGRVAGRPRPAPHGEVAWWLRGVSAGPGREPVLEGVDLAGRAGETLVLSGPNGGGKTTLLRVIAGLLKPKAGTAERRPGRAAYLPQNPSALLHQPTVEGEVRLTLNRAGSAEPPARLLGELGLLAVAGRYPRDLSTGEKQRVALAAVLAGRPRLALLDEPTRGMDARAREALVRLVESLKEDGASIVVATHDQDLAARLADRVVRVEGGRVA